MKKLLTPKNDFVFKKLFAADTEILTDLINCVLGLKKKNRIVSVEIKNPDILADEIGKKFIILDIRAIDESGREYDIEMQVRQYENYPQRTLFYLCRMYGDQLDTGEDYQELHPVIGIHFLDYEQFPKHDDFHYHFQMKDTRYPDLTFTNDLSLHIFELPGIERHIKAKKRNELAEWLYFFNHAHEEGEETMKEHYKNPMIHKAMHKLVFLSADEKMRELAERRERALKDEAMFLNEARTKGMKEGYDIGKSVGKEEGIEIGKEEGIEIGKEEGIEIGKEEGIEIGVEKNKKETILKLLEMNVLTEAQIAEVTGEDIEEIKKLKSGD